MFYFRLAQELGITVGRMLEEMSSYELGCWMAFLSIEDNRRKKEIESQKKKKSKASTELLRAHIKQAGEIAAQKYQKGLKHGKKG